MEQQWISVKKRLPKREGRKSHDSIYVLCVDMSMDVYVPFVAWYNHLTKKWTVAHHFATSGNPEITHWQLLPEPPIK